MGFLTWIFLPKENNTYQKLDILDFLPATKLNFFLATFFPCGWYAYSSIHFILCFYIEKLYVIMRKDTQWIWITESASLRNRHEMCNEWHRQTSESTRMYYVPVLYNVPLWILSTTYFMYVSDGNFASNSMYLDVSCTTCLYEKVRNFYPSYASLSCCGND